MRYLIILFLFTSLTCLAQEELEKSAIRKGSISATTINDFIQDFRGKGEGSYFEFNRMVRVKPGHDSVNLNNCELGRPIPGITPQDKSKEYVFPLKSKLKVYSVGHMPLNDPKWKLAARFNQKFVTYCNVVRDEEALKDQDKASWVALGFCQEMKTEMRYWKNDETSAYRQELFNLEKLYKGELDSCAKDKKEALNARIRMAKDYCYGVLEDMEIAYEKEQMKAKKIHMILKSDKGDSFEMTCKNIGSIKDLDVASRKMNFFEKYDPMESYGEIKSPNIYNSGSRKPAMVGEPIIVEPVHEFKSTIQNY